MAVRTEFTYPSADQITQIRALRWVPDEGTAPVGILQIVHGMQEFIDRYDDFAVFMAAHGFIVTGNDMLGHGGSIRNGDENYFGYFGENEYPGLKGDSTGEEDGNRTLIRDIRTLQMLTQDLYPDLPCFLLGHSMGSFLARQFLCLRGASLTAAVISGTAFHPAAETKAGMFLARFIAKRKGWFYRSPFLNNMALGSLNKQFEPARTKLDWLTRDESIVDAYVSDRRTQFVFTCNGYFALFKTLRYLTSKTNLEHMPKNLPVLFIAGAKDPVGNNGQGPKKTAAQFKSLGLQNTELKIYEEDRHEVLNELDRETVYADVLHFLEDKLC